VVVDSVRNKTGSIEVLSDHEIFLDVVPKGSKEFPDITVSRYLTASAKNESSVIAEVLNSPVIAYNRTGNGKTVYIGINPSPEWSNFYYSGTFPVFWLQLIRWVNRDESTLGVNNFHTGDYLPVSADTVITTPSMKTVYSSNLLLDEAGFYELDHGDRTEVIAASLLSERESDISANKLVKAMDDADLDLKKRLYPSEKTFCPISSLLWRYSSSWKYTTIKGGA